MKNKLLIKLASTDIELISKIMQINNNYSKPNPISSLLNHYTVNMTLKIKIKRIVFLAHLVKE